MLVLSRKIGEKVSIGDGVVITIVQVDKSSGQVKVGIDAPRDVLILRTELESRQGNSGEANGNRKRVDKGRV